jgi:phenylpropionate dioxygenase-like ring-hydroxylating dioxygenase large terminal subunit
MRSQEGFWREQAQVGKIWQLVGLTTSIQSDRDWFRSTLGGRSIFVQRFKEVIRGFENVCVHRGFPLRTEDKGNGPIRCGFHHWQYDQNGRAVGIPKCSELFGAQPRELNARLRMLDIATCGILIFARFPSERFQDSLEEYLGPGFDILKGMWSEGRPPEIKATDLKANWRLGHHISLDDYHIVAVHPTSFGKSGYLPLDVTNYYRFGRHSAYFYNADEQALHKMAEECRNGTYRPDSYRILQFFPNLLASFSAAGSSCVVCIQQYVPLAHNRTTLLTMVQEDPFPPSDLGRRKTLVRWLKRPLRRQMTWRFIQMIVQEDNTVCERMQAIAHQLDQPQIFGKQEERIAWFEENYADVVGDLR